MKRKAFAFLVVAFIFLALTGCEFLKSTKITIYFDVQGGEAVNSIKIEKTATSLSLPPTTKTGFEFVGWTLEKDSSVLFTIEQLDREKSTITLYAIWESVSINHLKFVLGNGQADVTMDVFMNQEILIDVPTKTGFSFLGWTLNPTTNTLVNLVDVNRTESNITLYAVWEEIVVYYQLTIKPNNGQNDIVLEYEYNETILFPNDLVKSGYQLLGYFQDEGFNQPFDEVTMPGQNVTIHAKWLVDDTNFTKNTLYFDIKSITGNLYTFDLMVGGKVRFAGYDMIIHYNDAVLKLKSFENGLNNITNNLSSNSFKFNYVDALNPVSAKTKLISFTFEVLVTTDTEITIEMIDMIDVTPTYQVKPADFSVINYTWDFPG